MLQRLHTSHQSSKSPKAEMLRNAITYVGQAVHFTQPILTMVSISQKQNFMKIAPAIWKLRIEAYSLPQFKWGLRHFELHQINTYTMTLLRDHVFRNVI